MDYTLTQTDTKSGQKSSDPKSSLLLNTGQKELTIVFTDSGLGALSIMGEFVDSVRKLENHMPYESLKIVFFNALKEAGQGYNTFSSMEERINIFNQVLGMLHNHYDPSLIAIACNTLSSIYPLTQFAGNDNKTFEIITSGRHLIEKHRERKPQLPVIILATQTTLDSGAYDFDDPLCIKVSGERLASLVEFDHTSKDVENTIHSIYNQIEKLLSGPTNISLFLGCTHYGYVKNLLREISKEYSFTIEDILNPNVEFTSQLIEMIIPREKQSYNNPTEISFSIESQAQILPSEIESITSLLYQKHNYLIDPLKKYVRLPKVF
jgi:glutamate racemase